jgi:hypothetical protein
MTRYHGILDATETIGKIKEKRVIPRTSMKHDTALHGTARHDTTRHYTTNAILMTTVH